MVKELKLSLLYIALSFSTNLFLNYNDSHILVIILRFVARHIFLRIVFGFSYMLWTYIFARIRIPKTSN